MTMFAYKLLFCTIVFAVIALVWKNLPTKSYITPQLDAYYDYVIVGAGSAGCVLANRLSEDSDVKVAILEAGDEEISFPLTDIPLAMLDLQRTSADWTYKTVPQNHSCKGMNNEQSAWPRGKLLGGSSSINALMYVRGNQLDYDKWAEAGATGWSYEEVMPYYIKAESNRNGRFSKTRFHGTLGPFVVQDSMATPKLTNAFVQSGIQLGYPNIDVNGKKQIGVSHTQSNIDWGRRVSTATAYLRPAIQRPNLHVATLAHVTKILFKDKTAIGVEYKQKGKLRQVRARKEVIISAGSIGSPQLLMLSGIGHRSHLEQMKIPVLADLPVGDNLQDHLFTDSTIYGLKEGVSITAKKAKGFIPLFDFLIFGQGFLTSGGSEGIAFSRSSKQPKEDMRPHLQLILFPFLIGNDGSRNLGNARKLNYNEKVYYAIHGNQEDKDGCILLPVLLHPKSRGTIRLNQTNPFTPPDINPNYLNEPDDLETLLDGIRLSQQFMESQYFKDLDAKRLMSRHPGCVEYEYDLDDYWRCYIKQNTLTMYHPVGTCKMGDVDDPTTVVDPELRVKGVSNLRVVDASIMPEIISGNPNAAVVMIAEKAADLIRDEVTVPNWGEEMEDFVADTAHEKEAHSEL